MIFNYRIYNYGNASQSKIGKVVGSKRIKKTKAMAQNFSFDIVSEVDFQEIDNSINQAKKKLFNDMI